MSALRDRLDDYVALRRSMGFVMKESSLLASFVRYMDQREAPRVTHRSGRVLGRVVHWGPGRHPRPATGGGQGFQCLPARLGPGP